MDSLDRTILSYLARNSVCSPKQIAQNRFRESEIRLKCESLSRDELVNKICIDVYTLSSEGADKVSSEINIDPGERWTEDRQIVDLSEIDPEDIKWRNHGYLKNRDHRYDLRPGGHLATKHDISVVRNGDLRRVLDEFPTQEPITHQCAHWVRSIVGLHFFPDANHRTAMATLNTILKLNSVDPFKWEGRKYENAIFKSKLLRKFVLDIRFDNLWMKDELFQLWHRYFAGLFYDLPTYSHKEPSYRDFDRLLDKIE